MLEMMQIELIRKAPICRNFAEPSNGLEPSTPSLPWKFGSVTRVHARSLAAQFLLQISVLQAVEMRRETSRVSFLMCPFCVRVSVPNATTRSTGRRPDPDSVMTPEPQWKVGT
jgi:hypothetical protein